MLGVIVWLAFAMLKLKVCAAESEDETRVSRLAVVPVDWIFSPLGAKPPLAEVVPSKIEVPLTLREEIEAVLMVPVVMMAVGKELVAPKAIESEAVLRAGEAVPLSPKKIGEAMVMLGVLVVFVTLPINPLLNVAVVCVTVPLPPADDVMVTSPVALRVTVVPPPPKKVMVLLGVTAKGVLGLTLTVKSVPLRLPVGKAVVVDSSPAALFVT